MREIKKLLLAVLRRLLVEIICSHRSLPSLIEKDLKVLQGKGIGASLDKNFEVIAAVNALERFSISHPIVLDIGANIGLYSATFLEHKPSTLIYAFEPSFLAREHLEKRFMSDSRVVIVPYAVGKEKGEANLFSDQPGSGLSSMTKRKLQHFGIEMNFTEKVDVITLDDWARESKVFPHLIKVDVEGHELDVFEGGREALSKVLAVQFEFGGCNIDTRTYFRDFWYFFNENKFNIYRIAAKKLIPIQAYSEDDEYFSTTNFLAIRDLNQP